MYYFWRMVDRVIYESDILLEVIDARMPNLTRNKKVENKIRRKRIRKKERQRRAMDRRQQS